MDDNTARTIGTVSVWASFAVVMAFGVCRMNWSGGDIFLPFILTIALICAAAVTGTAFIWRRRPSGDVRHEDCGPATAYSRA